MSAGFTICKAIIRMKAATTAVSTLTNCQRLKVKVMRHTFSITVCLILLVFAPDSLLGQSISDGDRRANSDQVRIREEIEREKEARMRAIFDLTEIKVLVRWVYDADRDDARSFREFAIKELESAGLTVRSFGEDRANAIPTLELYYAPRTYSQPPEKRWVMVYVRARLVENAVFRRNEKEINLPAASWKSRSDGDTGRIDLPPSATRKIPDDFKIWRSEAALKHSLDEFIKTYKKFK
jgi:hypothetical protein